MTSLNLDSLPPSILHKILSKVATRHLRDFGSARIAFSGFNQIGREDYFYRSADLIHLDDWIDEVNAVRTFRLRCYEAGNPEAIFFRVMYEFFYLHLLDQGRQKIHLAGERGLLLTKYVDGMLNLSFSVDDGGLVHNYPNFSREFVVYRMNHIMVNSLCSGHWLYEKPEVFLSLLERIKPYVYDCWCTTIEEPEFIVSSDGSRIRWRWRYDRCFWQNAVWDFCNEIHLYPAHWPIED